MRARTGPPSARPREGYGRAGRSGAPADDARGPRRPCRRSGPGRPGRARCSRGPRAKVGGRALGAVGSPLKCVCSGCIRGRDGRGSAGRRRARARAPNPEPEREPAPPALPRRPESGFAGRTLSAIVEQVPDSPLRGPGRWSGAGTAPGARGPGQRDAPPTRDACSSAPQHLRPLVAHHGEQPLNHAARAVRALREVDGRGPRHPAGAFMVRCREGAARSAAACSRLTGGHREAGGRDVRTVHCRPSFVRWRCSGGLRGPCSCGARRARLRATFALRTHF